MGATGLVIKSTGSWYKVRLEDGDIVDARARGKLRISGSKNTNIVTVGDQVDIEITGEDTSIISVHPRKNYIIRKSTNLSKQTHIIAANIDLAVVVASLKAPKIKFGFIDRFLVTAEAYDIPVLIVFNKCDLLSAEERSYLSELREAYRSIGYESAAISVKDNEGIDEIKSRISGKISLFSGHSGVGKSSLLKCINPDIDVKISDVSDANDKGQHTTTFAQMHEVLENSFIIDTPGLKSFGLTDMKPEELRDYYPEMVRISQQCKFSNCQHLNEPGCAVKSAYENGNLPWFRYENYQHFIEELKTLAI